MAITIPPGAVKKRTSNRTSRFHSTIDRSSDQRRIAGSRWLRTVVLTTVLSHSDGAATEFLSRKVAAENFGMALPANRFTWGIDFWRAVGIRYQITPCSSPPFGVHRVTISKDFRRTTG